MNVSRRKADGSINLNEPHQSQIYITSAGQKGSYAYDRLIELITIGAVDPKIAFCWGCDYKVPMAHGLLDKRYVDEMRMSSTYKDSSFAREYLSIWTGGNEDSWFDYERLSRHRTIVNPEKKHKKVKENKEMFYILSVDVARLDAQTVCTITKVLPQEQFFLKKIVNIKVMLNMHFAEQALEIKKLAEQFQVDEVVIDGTGLGVGLLDFMIQPSVDLAGNIYPAYGSFNDTDLKSKQPYDCKNIMYVIKANSKLNSIAHSNCFSQIASGHVKFLISEVDAKDKLLSTIKGQKMRPKERIDRLMPHEMTTRLFDEMCNLRAKQQVGADISLEMINKRMTKDKFSSLEYGLLRIKEIEEAYYKKKARKTRDISKFVFFGSRR